MALLDALHNTLDSIDKTGRTAWRAFTGADAAHAILARVAQQAALYQAPPNVDLRRVVPWHRLAESRTAMFWPSGAGGQATWLDPRQFQVTHTRHIAHADLDLRAFDGVSASRDALVGVGSLDAFAEQFCRHLLKDANAETALELMLQSKHLYVNGAEPSKSVDNFVWHQWDGRLFLSNSDFSHRFAAARSIAAAHDVEIVVGAPVTVHTIELHRVGQLRSKYDLFLMPPEEGQRVRGPTNTVHETMDRLRAPWGWVSMGFGEHEGYLLLLPRDDRRSVAAADTLRENGAADAGELLRQAAARPVPQFHAVDFDYEAAREPTHAPRM